MKINNDDDLHNLEYFLRELDNPFENDNYSVIRRKYTAYASSVAVAKTASPEFKKIIYAAMTAYEMGFKSVDYVIKKYGKGWQIEEDIPNYPAAISAITNRILKIIFQTLYKFSDDIKVAHAKAPEHMGIVAADLSLQRCLATFEAVTVLIRKGYFVESSSLLRNIIEQIGWSLAVSKLTEYKDIKRTSPSGSVTLLKKLHPKIGRIYGELSTYVHLDAKNSSEYISIEGEKDYVILKNKEATAKLLPLMINIADLYIIIYESIHLAYYKKTTAWGKNKRGELSLKPRRPMKKLIKTFLKILDEEFDKIEKPKKQGQSNT